MLFILSFPAWRSHSESRRQQLNRVLLSRCLLILMRVPFTVKNHKESLLRATTSPNTQLSLEPQNGYVTETWELILSRCLQSKQDQKVETEITKHLIRSWWNQGLRVGSAISETQRPCLFRGTSKPPINSQERWEANTPQRSQHPCKGKLETNLRCFPWSSEEDWGAGLVSRCLTFVSALSYIQYVRVGYRRFSS